MVDATTVFSDLMLSDVSFLGEAALRTIGISLAATAFGTLAGVIIGSVMASIPLVISATLAAILDIFRSVPLIIQLILFDSFFSILGLPLSAFQSGTFVLSVYCAALVAFLTKAGINSIPYPLRIAGRSLGLSAPQELRYIVMPLGLRAMFPTWLGIALSLLKDSSLVSVLGYIELIRASRILITRTQEPFLILAIVGTLFFLMSYLVSWIGQKIENRWSL